MNRQRKVLITITYNEMGIIIDTKAEELDLSAQPECKTGRWIKDRRASLNGGSYEVFVCSECGSAFNWRMRYCGHCGAKKEVGTDGRPY